jgi:hypothetical protein
VLGVSTNESVVFHFVMAKAAGIPFFASVALELYVALIMHTSENSLFLFFCVTVFIPSFKFWWFCFCLGYESGLQIFSCEIEGALISRN